VAAKGLKGSAGGPLRTGKLLQLKRPDGQRPLCARRCFRGGKAARDPAKLLGGARRGPTTSRHLINNLQVFATDDHHARLVAALSVFRANGPPPVQRAPSPCLIADVIGECVRGEDGTWRFRSHAVQPVFLGSDQPLSLAIDGQFLSRPSERIAR
jgi:hypothetical protein